LPFNRGQTTGENCEQDTWRVFALVTLILTWWPWYRIEPAQITPNPPWPGEGHGGKVTPSWSERAPYGSERLYVGVKERSRRERGPQRWSCWKVTTKKVDKKWEKIMLSEGGGSFQLAHRAYTKLIQIFLKLNLHIKNEFSSTTQRDRQTDRCDRRHYHSAFAGGNNSNNDNHKGPHTAQ